MLRQNPHRTSLDSTHPSSSSKISPNVSVQPIPLINREDIHKIVWMSLLEMAHKQGQENVQDDDSISEEIRKVAPTFVRGSYPTRRICSKIS